MSTTIVAIATPLGTGGVGIIRLSGTLALPIMKKIFRPAKSEEMTPRVMVFGKAEFNGISDDCLAVYFKAPHSFTGEDVVELQMHGGFELLNQTVEKLLECGATMATPGEFSKRAMLNGKMDITQAEALVDLINAQSVNELRVASSQVGGALSKRVKKIQDELTDILAQIEVALDFPEHEEQPAHGLLIEKLPALVQELQTMSSTESLGRKLKNGVAVALIGEPNVGKSSLLNALVGHERAIVTEIAGTTRDVVDDSFQLNGVRFNVFDTAGIRESEDRVEKEGIKKSVQMAQDADLVLYVLENGKKDQNFLKIKEKIGEKLALIKNKSDIQKDDGQECDLRVSAKDGTNIDTLKEFIFKRTIDSSLLSSQIIITNLRHAALIKKALHALMDAQKCAEHTSLECTAVLLQSAWSALGEITGETANELIIDAIFSKFCLGK